MELEITVTKEDFQDNYSSQEELIMIEENFPANETSKQDASTSTDFVIVDCDLVTLLKQTRKRKFSKSPNYVDNTNLETNSEEVNFFKIETKITKTKYEEEEEKNKIDEPIICSVE